MPDQYAPVVVFAYNRPDHLSQMLTQLSTVAHAAASSVFVFSDGPKHADAENDVVAVRAVLRDDIWQRRFKSFSVVEADRNKGLAVSIVGGVTQILKKHDSVIVLEDDLLVAEDFLTFINACLVYYRSDRRVGSVTGYCPLDTRPDGYDPDVMAVPRMCSHGWAIWADRWRAVDWTARDAFRVWREPSLKQLFNSAGSDLLYRLRREMAGRIDTWAIIFQLWQVLSGRHTIYPVDNRISNIGYDGSGVHTRPGDALNTEMIMQGKPFKLTSPAICATVVSQFHSAYSGSFPGRIKRSLKNALPPKANNMAPKTNSKAKIDQVSCSSRTRIKVLFRAPSLSIGGAEMSTLRLVAALADRGHDVTLVVTTAGGALESAVDPRVRLVRLRPGYYGQKFFGARTVAGRIKALPDLLAYAGARAVGGIRMLPFLFRHYDAAATLMHGASTWFCRRIARGRRQLHFIRNDLSHVDPTGRMARAIRRALPEIDYYVCVSQVARRSLVAAVPETAPKATVVHNILNPDEMRCRMTESGDPFPVRHGDELRVLTVCRLIEAAKGLTRMVLACRRLADQGLDFRWFVVGDGLDRPLLENAIRDAGIEERMILLGRFSNPFPAYAHADVVAMLSHYEGLCGIVNEAKVAGCAIVATRVSGIDEQLVNGETGVIVNNDEEAIVVGMQQVLSDPALRTRITNNRLPPALLDDTAKVDRLERLMQGKIVC